MNQLEYTLDQNKEQENDDQEPKRTADGIFNVTLVCRLVADPELRYTPSGTAVCNMRTAVNLRVQENGDWNIKTVWVK